MTSMSLSTTGRALGLAGGTKLKLDAARSRESVVSSRCRRAAFATRAEAEPKAAETATVEEPASTVTKIEAPAGFVPAEPKRFAVGQGQLVDILTAGIPSLLRLGSGALTSTYSVKLQDASTVPAGEYFVGPVLGRAIFESSAYTNRPEKPIILYEFEGCPFCRKVREAVSILDLDVLYYPCPQGSPNYRPEAIALGGKKQFPYMVDPNTGVSMYESNDIIKYLCNTYGDGTVPLMLRLGLVTDITAGLAQLGRIAKGSRYVPAKKPSEPLELWAYEASPFCKIVREVLVELELPHVYHSTPRGSAKRKELIEKTGRFQVPYLEDPNTGVKTFESAAIIDYLKKTYAIPAAS